MSTFVFSADTHLVEPGNIYLDSLPASLHQFAPNAVRDDRTLLLRVGDKVVHRTKLGARSIARETKGQTDLERRLEDMEVEGVDAELTFPTLGLLSYFIGNPEAELLCVQAWNNWVYEHVKTKRDTFVPAGMLPVRDLRNTVKEIHRLADLGFTAAMLPVVAPEAVGEYCAVPKFNDEAWDPVFAAAQQRGVVFTLHTGTGQSTWIVERGPGAAIINYALQMNDASAAIMYLVAGGVLDRYQQTQVAFVECGASWLSGVAERMDEVNRGHSAYVHPPLSRLPSQIVRDQIKCTFQTDRGALGTRAIVGHESLLWANDYPHMEGTFPDSREYRSHLFEGFGMTEAEIADVLGLNAARLFRLDRAGLAL